MFFTLDCLHGTISFHHSDMFFFQLNIFYFERIFDLLKLGRKASSQGGLSGWLKNGTVLVCFHFSTFWNQCWQKSEYWRVCGKARGTRFEQNTCFYYIVYNNALFHTKKSTWVHCWAWCPVRCCQPKPGALLGIMPSNRLHSACNPHALLGMMPSNVQVLPGTDTLLGMMPSNVPFLGCKSALCWAWCPGTLPAMRKLCQESLRCHRT